eukprot:IDg23606t1
MSLRGEMLKELEEEVLTRQTAAFTRSGIEDAGFAAAKDLSIDGAASTGPITDLVSIMMCFRETFWRTTILMEILLGLMMKSSCRGIVSIGTVSKPWWTKSKIILSFKHQWENGRNDLWRTS